MTPRQQFDLQVNLMLPNLVGVLRDELGRYKMLDIWKDADPETLRALSTLDRAINNLNEVTEKHLEGVK